MDDMEIIRQYAIQILKHIRGSKYTQEYSTGIFRIIGGVFSILVGLIGLANSPDMILGFMILLAIGVFLIFFGVKKVNSRNDGIKSLSGLIANYVISIKNQRKQRGLSPISTADIINFIQKTHIIYDDATVFDIDTKIFEGHSKEEISKMISEILHKNKGDQSKAKKENDPLIDELNKYVPGLHFENGENGKVKIYQIQNSDGIQGQQRICSITNKMMDSAYELSLSPMKNNTYAILDFLIYYYFQIRVELCALRKEHSIIDEFDNGFIDCFLNIAKEKYSLTEDISNKLLDSRIDTYQNIMMSDREDKGGAIDDAAEQFLTKDFSNAPFEEDHIIVDIMSSLETRQNLTTLYVEASDKTEKYFEELKNYKTPQ